jgi:hypothetical protein
MSKHRLAEYMGEVVMIEWIDPCVDVVGSVVPEGGDAVARGLDIGRVHSIHEDVMVLTTRQLAGPKGGAPMRQQYAAVPVDSIHRITLYKPTKPLDL